MALVIAMAMVVAMALPAFGASITLKSDDTHTYKVFQVLTGTLASEGSKQLGDPEWGADAIAEPGDVDAFITEITAAGLSEAEVAAKVAAKVNTSGDGQGTVTADTPLENLATGYYVLVDVTNLDPDEDGKVLETQSLHVVQVLNDVTMVQIKYGTTEDDKTITADTLGKDTGENTYADGEDNNNVSIGDTVSYNIAATVPDNADKFKPGTFFFVITDKLSSGLTMVETGEEGNKVPAIEVYDGETKLGTDKYTLKYPGTNGNTFEIGLINAASYKGHTINVKYSAILNENAVIGDAGNANTSTVQFSNNPNQTYDGSPEDQNNPGFPDSTQNVPTGETPESETKTYSTGIEILKVDENGEPLTGVTFELAGQSAKKVVTKNESFVIDNDKGTYYKLKNNTYTTTAPTTENTMIPAEAGATKGYVEDADATGTGVITIGEKKYRPYVPATDTGKTLYILQEGSADAYADNNKYRKEVNQKTVDSDVTDHKMSESVDAQGLARFDGLGAGEYTLTETANPDGYNTVAPVTLTITFDEDGEAKFSATGATYEDGVLKIRVVNKKGTELPSTGGIGTTIFYVIGTVLVLGAGVVLITRRRMDA